MKFHVLSLAGAVLMAASAAQAGLETVLDGGWRISAGAVYDSGVKTDVRFSPRQSFQTPYSLSPGALSRAQAREAAWGKKSGTKTTYTNTRKGGAQSWVDTDDPGEPWGSTVNYRMPMSVWDENTAFELGYATYEEMSYQQGSMIAQESALNDEKAMPGVSIQFSRNLYHDEEYGWGVEAAFGVQYARRNNVLKSASNWLVGQASKTTGGYSSTYNARGELAEVLPGSTGDADVRDILWGNDNAIGGDFFPIHPTDIAENEWGGGSSQSYTERGSYNARGDYDNLELMLLLQPYYDICSWFSVNATFGMVVSRQSMEMSFSMMRNGALDYHSDRDFSQWDVYGVAGLGAMIYYRGFTLSGDFLARFWDRSMDIEDVHYRGSVERGDWMFRLMLGYEF